MPYSTGSDDSGLGLGRCFEQLSATTSSLTCSEDEFHVYPPPPLPAKTTRGTSGRGGGKNRKQRRSKQGRGGGVPALYRPASTPSTCSSEDSGGLLVDEAFFGCSDVVQIYLYFQQLLHGIREQQKYFQDMAKIVGDIDGRWGASGYKNGWRLDPTGSLAPCPGGDGQQQQLFDGFWAHPHPAVYLSLLANYIQEYLHFLRCIYPQVSGQGALHSSVPNIRLPTYAEMLLPKDQQHKRRQGEPQKRDRLEETRESPASTPGAADTTLVASETTPADESSKSDSVLLPGSPACEETTTTTTPSSTLNNAPPTPPPSEPVDSCGNFEVSRMDVLSEQIWDFHNQITQKNETLTKKLSLRDMLYYAISPVFPMCGLYVVGSSLNGFGNDRSDMDLCLMITNKDLDQKTDAVVVLNMILTTLQKMDWVTYQKLILAKVPILRIRFAAPYDDITVDLNANNSVAIKNTHLLCYYSSFDWRVRPLVSIVKEWAKRKGINDANRSSFTSYSLVLMVIHYLQCGMQPALLPSLQTKFPKRFHPRVDVRMLSVTQPLAADLDWTFHEKATLGELLIGFLKYFSSKFDYDSHAISVREGKLITRKAVTRSRSNNFNNSNNNVTWRSQWRCICIEEPFTFSNTAHSIYDEMVFDAIKKSFKEAHDELERTRDINRLLECSPITVVPPIHGATAYVYDGVSREATLESGNGHGAAVVAATAATATAAATTPAATSVAAAVAAGAPSPSSR